MKTRKTQVILLIDALGWELAERSRFLSDRLPNRSRLRTILGYSSAAIPSLLTGVKPEDHGHWFLYFRASKRNGSPFRGAGIMALLPSPIRDKWVFRRRLADWWRKSANITGYFGLYEVPYRELKDLDYVERRDTWAPGTFDCGSYMDDIAALGDPVFVSDWRVPDDAKFEAALKVARSSRTRIFVLYLTEIDARQHEHGSRAEAIDARLSSYRTRIDELLGVLERQAPVSLTVCSDHGMTDVTRIVDPGPSLRGLSLVEGRDFRVFIDSTFLRIWTADSRVADRVGIVFGECDWCRVLGQEDLQREGVLFADGRYGDVIILAHPGVLICPSFMGRSPLKGMHGYSPDDAASDAVLLRGSGDVPAPKSILDLRRLFLKDVSGSD